MQLEHLALYMKIAQSKSISKAASLSHISQPALSLQMQKMEDDLGVQLFERSNRGIKLTPAGIIAERYAAQMTATYERLLEELSNLRNNCNTCRIAASRVLAHYAIPCSLIKAKEKFPQFTFTLTSIPSGDVIRLILGGEADIGFIVGNTSDNALFCKNVFSEQIVLVAAQDYPVNTFLSIHDLRNHPMILLNENYSSYHLLASQLTSQGYDPGDLNVIYHMDSTESVKSMVISGNGISFLPYMAVKKEVYLQQLKIIEMDDFCLQYDVSIVYRLKSENCDFKMTILKKYFENAIPHSIC